MSMTGWDSLGRLEVPACARALAAPSPVFSTCAVSHSEGILYRPRLGGRSTTDSSPGSLLQAPSPDNDFKFLQRGIFFLWFVVRLPPALSLARWQLSHCRGATVWRGRVSSLPFFFTGLAASPAVVDFISHVIRVLAAAKQPLIGCADTAERGVHSFLLAAEAGLTAGGPGRALVKPGLGKRPPHDPAYAQVTASQGGEEVNLDSV